MVIPVKFRKSSEQLVNYNWVDAINGSGIQIFYLGNSQANTTINYYISPSVIRSQKRNIQAAITSAWPNYGKNLDVDFDIIFSSPRTIFGKVRGNISVGGRTTSAAPNNWKAYAIIKLRKWDGTTETEIASTQTKETAGGNNAVNTKESEEMSFSMDIPQTSFKIGETLRITVEIWGTVNGNANAGFGCDPSGRTDLTAASGGIIEDTDSTIARIDIPFKINI